MKKIKVNLTNNSYDIFIGKSIYPAIVDLIEELKLYKNILLVLDENLKHKWEDYIKNPFGDFKNKIEFYYLKPGENSKSFIELNNIYSYLIKKNFGRDTLIIAVGGGVTGDLVGYAASTFMRGVQLVQVPTTLLAAIDSSIGGKTGINFDEKKNMIGSFYQPKFVFTDINFISTLPEGEITSGIGEIIKYAFLSDESFFEYTLENIGQIYKNDEQVITEVIFNSASIKSAVVSQDEKETGLRKILNFGHTFAHAVESDLHFSIKHGEAVAAGIISALCLSNKLGILEKAKMEDFLELPLKISFPSSLSSLNEINMINIMQMDKKNRGGKINFVLLSGIGKILIDLNADKNDVLYAIQKMKELLIR